MRQQRTFYEFFCGGGLVRLGLGDEWKCVGAVDNNISKITAYRQNFGDCPGLTHGDVRNISPDSIPGVLDLAWASSPCQDLSVAGTRTGMSGTASGAFWPFWQIIQRLVENDRAPRVVTLENVRNLISVNDGKDFAVLVGALVSAGYKVGVVILDARAFLPQSRKRIFVVAVRADIPVPSDLHGDPTASLHPPDLRRAVASLPAFVRQRCVWWRLPQPAPSRLRLADLLDPETTTEWHTSDETTDLVANMEPRDLDKVGQAQSSGKLEFGTIYVRSRPDVAQLRRRRANVRLDGVANCLLTPNGRMSSQIILAIEGESLRTRYMTATEGARLMGLPPGYRLPKGYNNTFNLFGEGVVVPVVSYLARHLLGPLVDAAASWRPRTEMLDSRPQRATVGLNTIVPSTVSAPKVNSRPGIKGATVGTTVYLLPEESKRLRRLALELDISLHELLMRGADRLLAENGQMPVQRYRSLADETTRVSPKRKRQ